MDRNQIPCTEDLVERIKKFLEDGTVPDLPRSSLYKFKARYSGPEWSVKGDRVLYNGKELVPREQVASLLERLYQDPLYTHHTAIRFHNRISTEFVGVSLSMVNEFLSTKCVPQMFKRPKPKEITPICTKYPRQMFNIDFVDLKSNTWANRNKRYLLNSVDRFSKFA